MGPDQSVGPGGLATPGTRGCLRALPQQSDALLAFRSGGGVVWPTHGAPRTARVWLFYQRPVHAATTCCVTGRYVTAFRLNDKIVSQATGHGFD